MQTNRLDPEACYRAVASRDARFDGTFFTAVRTTGIYCRPVCPARTPLRRNVEFFRHAAAAEASGYRSCRRCRPESGPGSPDWDVRGDLVGRALRLICDGVADDGGVAEVARRLHVSERHLHRIFVAELGAAPLTVARTQRVQLALRLLDDTDLPVTDIAYAAGFGSLRQFNAVIRELYGRPPSALRSERRSPPATGLALRLRHRDPYDGAAMLRWLGARAVPGIEEIEAGTYRRALLLASGPAVVEIEPGPDAVELRLPVGDPRHLGAIVAATRRVFDLDVDPLAVHAVLGQDPVLAPLLAARPGLRVPGAWDGFELTVRAVVGQQVSVAAARTLLGRLVQRLGTPLPTAVGSLDRTFPTAATVAEADLSGLGLTGARVRTLQSLAAAVTAGTVVFDGSAPAAETAAALLELPGIGPWTVDYVRLRALRDPDALPVGDLVIRRAFAALGGTDLHAAARRWRPWAGYAAIHLWARTTKEN